MVIRNCDICNVTVDLMGDIPFYYSAHSGLMCQRCYQQYLLDYQGVAGIEAFQIE